MFNHKSAEAECDAAAVAEKPNMDACDGHSSPMWEYHYHQVPNCIPVPRPNRPFPWDGWGQEGWHLLTGLGLVRAAWLAKGRDAHLRLLFLRRPHPQELLRVCFSFMSPTFLGEEKRVAKDHWLEPWP